MGLWHGANWTFVFWGLYHSLFIYLERFILKYRSRKSFLNNKIITVSTTLLISMLSWIPFRAQNLEDTLIIYIRLFDLKILLHIHLKKIIT